MSQILAVDPGNEQSGFCIYNGEIVEVSGIAENDKMAQVIDAGAFDHLAIEMIASYGMPVGREVFETCVWIGRFIECYRDPDVVRLIYRKDVKLHLCGSTKAKDSNIRQALLDMFPRTGGGKTPQVGTKAQPGPLYGVSSHAWAALGVAITAAHQMKESA
jgi:hypothetical protein